MNKIAKEILEKLDNHGFTSYIVGGYVRDYLLGMESTDIDICTNATMRDVVSFLPGDVNGYHSLHIKKNEFNIDITSFRVDGEYENRKPKEVFYTMDLEEDLERRDFTINTICMNKEGEIIDLLNGISDLKRKKIKMVGDPLKKLEEDPLRILRAIRFATVLNFELDNELEQAIREKGALLKNLSAYRIKEELSKILVSPHYKKGLSYLKNFSLCAFLGISFKNIVYTKDVCGMWAQVEIVRELPFTKQEKKNIVKIQEIVHLKIINSEVIYTYGLYLSLIAGEILGIEVASIYEIYNCMPLKERKDLSISFQEIEEWLQIFDPKKIKGVEEDIIREVLNGHIKNKKEVLKEFILMHKSRWS